MELPKAYLDRILLETAKKGATNLHFSAGSAPVLRIDGKLNSLEKESPLSLDLLNKLIGTILDESEMEKFKQAREITVVKNFVNDFRFQASIFYQKNLPAISFSYISDKIKTLSELGLPKELSNILNFNSGLLIIAGPNDSGKTSTITALLEEVNKNSKKYINTLEYPIKYIFNNKKSIIDQRGVGKDVESFQAGLEHCLEEDVDIIYVDDLKKEFNASVPLVLELAAGNSLVIMEMKAENALRALEKIIGSSEKKSSSETIRYALADILIGVIVQRLIPKRGGGLALALEIFFANPAAKSLIREGKIQQLENIIQTSRSEGMVSMKKSIEDLEKSGLIEREEVQKFKL
ncbi:MAG: ATPase, T2SS/T4P/T4SS family [Patescibacteria group bacterium]|nr:ATPase, T2SS/T4P/T4SS family [Patescibacteria group bacterium]MDD4610862.1 ATPase, T2SS/T4P/T4SS family [Patescibacteria group bacterium]